MFHWSFIIYHCLWKHCLNHFVDVIIRFESSISWTFDTVIVYRLIFFLLIWAWALLISILWERPVKANITCSLMTKLKSAFGLLLRNSPENQQSLLSFFQVLVIWFNEWVGNVYFPGQINLLLLVLIKHHIANILNIEEILLLETLDQVMDNFLFHPNEHKSVFHHLGWDIEILLKFLDRNFVIMGLRSLFLRRLVHRRIERVQPWRVYQYSLNVFSMLTKFHIQNLFLRLSIHHFG